MRISEIIFTTNQIKLPHPDKGFIIMLGQLVLLRFKAGAPMAHGFGIMQTYYFNIGYFQSGFFNSLHHLPQGRQLAAGENIFN